MTLLLTTDLQAEIARHGMAAYPYEGCGLLLGEMTDGVKVVRAVQPTPNVWPEAEERRVRFRIAERDWLAAELAAAAQGLDIIGVFHSHPDHPPVASPRDLAWAAWSGYSYLITEIRAGQAHSSRSWELNPTRTAFDEELIQVSPG